MLHRSRLKNIPNLRAIYLQPKSYIDLQPMIFFYNGIIVLIHHMSLRNIKGKIVKNIHSNFPQSKLIYLACLFCVCVCDGGGLLKTQIHLVCNHTTIINLQEGSILYYCKKNDVVIKTARRVNVGMFRVILSESLNSPQDQSPLKWLPGGYSSSALHFSEWPHAGWSRSSGFLPCQLLSDLHLVTNAFD